MHTRGFQNHLAGFFRKLDFKNSLPVPRQDRRVKSLRVVSVHHATDTVSLCAGVAYGCKQPNKVRGCCSRSFEMVARCLAPSIRIRCHRLGDRMAVYVTNNLATFNVPYNVCDECLMRFHNLTPSLQGLNFPRPACR